MNYLKPLLNCTLWLAVINAMEPAYIIKKEPGEPKNILICSSTGGGGHRSVAQALKGHFPQYQIEEIFPLRDILAPIDFIRTCSGGKYSCEDFYNYLLSNRNNKTINLLSQVGCYQMNWHNKQIAEHLYKEFEQKKPNVIFSIIPFINQQIGSTAQQLAIPFVLIPTDLDITTFMYGLTDDIKKSTALALAFDKKEILSRLTGLSKFKTATITGFPLKPDFFRTPSFDQLTTIRNNFSIPGNKLVCMLLMGAAGSSATLDYTKNIVNSAQSLHTLVCLGRNEQLKPEIEQLALTTKQTLSIIGNTDKIADLMSVSDFIITKSGTVSVCEALKKQLPMIVDATIAPLKWEALNHELVEKYGLGSVMRSPGELPDLLKKFVHKDFRKTIRKNMASFDSKNFSDHAYVLLK